MTFFLPISVLAAQYTDVFKHKHSHKNIPTFQFNNSAGPDGPPATAGARKSATVDSTNFLISSKISKSVKAERSMNVE